MENLVNFSFLNQLFTFDLNSIFFKYILYYIYIYILCINDENVLS